MKRTLLAMLSIVATVVAAGCFGWQYNTSYAGVAFAKVRIERGLAIGLLKEDTVIAGRPCRAGWVHVRANGIPAGFTAARDIDAGRFTIPAGTWVFQDAAGVVTVCAFPRDTQVQGHLCRGSWMGPEGVQAAFYPSGALKQYFLRSDTVIQGIPCKAGSMDESIELYENGRLKACALGVDLVRGGRAYAKGRRVHFDPEGRILD